MIYDSNLNCNTISCQNTTIWYFNYIYVIVQTYNYDSLIVRTVAFPVQVAYWI